MSPHTSKFSPKNKNKIVRKAFRKSRYLKSIILRTLGQVFIHMWYNTINMDLTSVKTIKELLSQHGARASKGLGQNFLIDKNALKKIIKAADLKPSDNVLEIGPGVGTLTQELAKNMEKVIAVEKDKKMWR